MSTNTFSEVYRSFSNLQLYEILQNKHDYQPVAIEAALAEWENRQLSTKDIGAIEEEWKNRLSSSQEKAEKYRDIKNKVKDYGNKIVDDLDPLQSSSIDRDIRIICIGSTLIILYYLITSFNSFKSIFTDFSTTDIPYLLNDLPGLLVIPGIWKFWNKKKIGWALLCFWAVHVLIGVAFYFCVTLRFLMDSTGFLVPGFNIFELIIPLLIFGGLLFYITTKKIRSAFTLSGDYLFYVLLTSITLSICLDVLAIWA